MEDLADAYFIFIFSASSIPICSIMAISWVILDAPMGMTPEWRNALPWYTAIFVVEAPISIRVTPSSISSSWRVARAAARG